MRRFRGDGREVDVERDEERIHERRAPAMVEEAQGLRPFQV